MLRSPTKVSPASVPSLSATTAASSTSFTDQVVRELFASPQDKDQDIDRHILGESLHIEVDRESLYGSDISVASEGTYVSTDRNDDRNDRNGHNDYRDGDSPVDGSHVKIFPGCHGAINLPPNFASTMFHMFDSSQRADAGISSENSVNDAATEVASNIDHSILLWERKIDSLEREITTLKGIIKSDSLTILSLKTALFEFDEKEIMSTQDFVSEQGSELSTQKVKEYEETIQHLHDEIEVLTSKEDSNDKDSHEAQLQLQNELFASQIIESETEIRQTRDIIAQMAEENVKLSMELLELRSKPVPPLESRDVKISDSNSVLQAELHSIKNWMNDIEQKLESGFYCRCAQNSENSRDAIVDLSMANPKSVEPLFDREDEDEIDEHPPNNDLTVNCLDVEVTIDGTIITTTGMDAMEDAADEKLPTQTSPTCTGDDPSHVSGIQNLEVAETDCNFCDCLRTMSIAKEAKT